MFLDELSASLLIEAARSALTALAFEANPLTRKLAAEQLQEALAAFEAAHDPDVKRAAERNPAFPPLRGRL